MDSEKIERFFIQYLDDVGLEYISKDRVFTIKLDKIHQKLYSQEKDLLVTFDVNIAQKKNIQLLGLGTFIIDSIIAKYSGDVLVANLIFPSNDDHIVEVNEGLESLKNNSSYMISEVKDDFTYILFETNIRTANETVCFLDPVLITKNLIIEAPNLEDNIFEISSSNIDLNLKHINDSVLFINKKNKLSLNNLTKKHYKDMDELKKIQTEHANTQYKELEYKEQKIRDQIETARVKSISVASFNAKAKWDDAIKRFRKKLDKLITDNKKKKEKIKHLFDDQIYELNHRELDTSIEIKTYANIKMDYFNLDYSDGTKYSYLPIIKKFIKIN